MASASCCARPRAPPPLSRSPPSASPCRRPCARSQTPDPQPKSAMSCHGLAAARVCVPCQWLGFADCRRSVKVLIAYGDAITKLRVPRENVNQQLRKEGLVKFLRPDWRGSANVVLTTYETLRDLEFSFAAVKWSAMVCDEAQRIKNPNAMTTRAAKKMNVTFRIACTGTPVENTLTDLWCLFDYVQPGLLGALNDFGSRYRRPIEAETDEEKARVEELRALISPQILRRTKKEVAKDLH